MTGSAVGTSSGVSVLLVDDSEVNQQLWSAILEAEGYNVVSARSGEEALSKVASEAADLDLMILDVVMPGISGFEVLEQVRAEHSSDELPVIMATSKDHKDDVVRAFRLGANDYVTKPLDREVTLARIAAQLRHRVSRPGGRAAAEPAGVRDDADTGQPGDHLIGRVIEDKYRIDALIGHGNFGAVFRATHLSLARPVALKLLRNRVRTDSTSLARFRQEGVSLSRLQHPNVVAVLDFGADEGLTYLVMELLDGHSLDIEIDQQGSLGLERARDVALPICEVLSEAHAHGIIHRDIKPPNVFLHRSRQSEVVKVLDFGIAKLVGDADLEQRLTLEGNSVGTPAYMAPERFTDEPYGGATDVYSLGVMLYEMLVGQTPFAAAGNSFFKLIRQHVAVPPRSLRAHDPDLPPAIDELVLAALEKRPADRPTPAEMATVLRSVNGAGVG